MGMRFYFSQGGPHNDYQSYGDTVVPLKPKVVIHINGFYLPCPTVKQMGLTKDLIDHVGQKYAPGFSVNIISPETSINQHCGFASPIEHEGLLFIVLYVKLHHGVAPNYEQIQSLHEKIVDLSTDYYESTKHIVPSSQVWGKHFILGLTPYLPGTIYDAYIRKKFESEEVIPTDGGGWCNEVETGGHGMMGWGPAASTLKDMPVRTQHARF